MNESTYKTANKKQYSLVLPTKTIFVSPPNNKRKQCRVATPLNIPVKRYSWLHVRKHAHFTAALPVPHRTGDM